MYLEVKNGPVWKFEILAIEDPKTLTRPRKAPRGPGTPKLALIIQSNHDHWWQKINFRRGQFFGVFYLIWPFGNVQFLFNIHFRNEFSSCLKMYIVERILTACELSNTDCKHSFHSLDKVGTAPKNTISDISYFASMLLAAARHDMGESTIIGPRQTTDY